MDVTEMAARYESWARDALARYVDPASPQFQHAFGFVRQRFAEGASLARLIRQRAPSAAPRVLDLGAGNGGVALGLLGGDAGLAVTALDHRPFPEIPELAAHFQRPLPYAVGQAQALPFQDGAFDAVLVLDVIEHVDAPRAVGREVARVTKSGGLVVVTTPPRIRFLLRGDPHYAIPGLAWLPRAGQRLVAERLLRRTDCYDVRHLYWTARGIERLFPGSFRWDYPRCARKLGVTGMDWDRLVGQKG